jgi:hypothetical protein
MRVCIFKRVACWGLALAASGFLGCQSPGHSANGGRERAVLAAKQYALKQWGWHRIRVVGAQFIDNEWIVVIYQPPPVPGGGVTIRLSEEGRVIDFRTGK